MEFAQINTNRIFYPFPANSNKVKHRIQACLTRHNYTLHE